MIRPEDRHAQRFLWKTSADAPIQEYEMMSMTFGAASSPCSAQYIKNRNARRFIRQHPRAVNAIEESHYADDFVKSFDNEDEAIEVSKEVIQIHAAASLQLRNFTSNSERVRRHFGVDGESRPSSMDAIFNGRNERVLGLYWDTATDEFTFEFRFHRVPQIVLDGYRPPTKRELLSLIMYPFDPLGFVADKMITAKLILQQTWSLPVDWDDTYRPNWQTTFIHGWTHYATSPPSGFHDAILASFQRRSIFSYTSSPMPALTPLPQ